MDLRLKHPCTAMICGPTQSGKSTFVVKLIEGENFNTVFNSIIWCYSISYPALNVSNFTKLMYNKGIPSFEQINQVAAPALLILDDQMRNCDSTILDMFTKNSHHLGISVIFLTQNLYFKGKYNRDISLNSHYLILFKNPRDYTQAQHLSRQVCKHTSKHFMEAYVDATRRPHGYLLVDLQQSTPEDCRFRTNIFGEMYPGYPIIYTSNKYHHTDVHPFSNGCSLE